MGRLHVLAKDKDEAKKEATVLRAREHILSAQIDLLKKFPQALNLPQPLKRRLKKKPSDESSASCSTRCPEEGLPPVEEAQQSQEPEPDILPKDLENKPKKDKKDKKDKKEKKEKKKKEKKEK